MTLIRFMKERARQIVFDQDPGFKVVAYEQIETGKGIYECRTIIHELSTGKFFRSQFRAMKDSSGVIELKPFENDDPVFQEVELTNRFEEGGTQNRSQEIGN